MRWRGCEDYVLVNGAWLNATPDGRKYWIAASQKLNLLDLLQTYHGDNPALAAQRAACYATNAAMHFIAEAEL